MTTLAPRSMRAHALVGRRVPPVVWPLLVAANVALTGMIWWRGDGAAQFEDEGGIFIGLGQLAALWGVIAVLCQLVLISRTPWLERTFGLDTLNHWHRWVGFVTTWILIVHAALITVGYAIDGDDGIGGQIVDFIRFWPNVLASMVGLVLLVGVAVTSVRIARRRLAYETWHFVHLYTYLALGLAFAHQLTEGTHFEGNLGATVYWVGLHLVVLTVVLAFRWITPLWRAWRHRAVIQQVQPEADSAVSLVVSGRDLDRLGTRAGQFFIVRFLARGRRSRAHPFSVSAVPIDNTLRFTVKAAGDDTRWIQRVTAGTPVALEGPYGVFTADRATQTKVLFIAGGIGVTPLRALFEGIERNPGEVTMLYRVRSAREAPLLDELHELAGRRGFALHVSQSRGDGAAADPFDAEALRRLVPDIADHDVFVCGPGALISDAFAGLRRVGVPGNRIHAERFAY